MDAGSCNGCEIENAAAFRPVYDAEAYGPRLVAPPRHADMALLTGPVTRNMGQPLRRTEAAMAEPRLVIAVGDCAPAVHPYQARAARRRVSGTRITPGWR
ncbi:hypothetical protein [Streptomyces barringtoniae]|uniref:NADH-quinone oxidoreductase subunit B family protein n=1 Tax=Streptomyces barringtoniae TaxID=2892029 RepID=UPI0027E28CFD|nr:hypothetical protein [Streptomyces barringtoniae]